MKKLMFQEMFISGFILNNFISDMHTSCKQQNYSADALFSPCFFGPCR